MRFFFRTQHFKVVCGALTMRPGIAAVTPVDIKSEDLEELTNLKYEVVVIAKRIIGYRKMIHRFNILDAMLDDKGLCARRPGCIRVYNRIHPSREE